MEWEPIVSGLVQTGAFGWVAKLLWKKMEDNEKARESRESIHQAEIDRKDLKIEQLNQARLNDLKAMMKLTDSRLR